MKKLYTLLTMLVLFTGMMWGQTAYTMSSGNYSEGFSDIANWTNGFASGTGASHWGSVAVNATGTIGDGVRISVSTATFTSGSSGGVQRGSSNIYLLSTSTANACAIDLYLDFSGRTAGTISFDVATVFNSTGDRDSKLKLFYTTDGTTFTEITGTNLPYTARNNVASSASISVSLPSALDGASSARLRFYEHSTTAGATPTGSQPKISIDNIAITSSAASSPLITVTPNTLTGFIYAEGSGPSTSQSYGLSGENLTPSDDDITVNGSTNYEVSLDDETFSSSVLVPYTGGTLSETPIYVRLKSGLSVGNYSSETISNAGGGATTKNVTVSGSVTALEPTNYPTVFAAILGTPSYGKINLTWTDAGTGSVPDGYLIKGSAVGFGNIANPVDGTQESDDMLVKNIAQGIEEASFGDLVENTTYYFKIFSYRGSEANINYKTDGSAPEVSISTNSLPSGLLFSHNFDYSGVLTSHGWGAHSGAGSNAISTTTGLTYADYQNSAIGNAALVSNLSGEDINFGFTAQSTHGNSVFASFLVNVTDPSSSKTGDYFFHLGNRNSSSDFTLFAARVGVKITSDVVNFGISNTSTIAYGTTAFLKNTVYLLIIKYTINTGGNDEVSLWIVESGVPSTEVAAGTPEVTSTTTAGTDIINAVALRQGSNTNSVQIVVDGIRIADGWPQAPLPVELTSFTAISKGRGVELVWNTATEVNNYGFEIEKGRMKDELGSMNWEKIGFVEGNGTTNAPKSYTFVDGSASGTVAYRLKQIDRDGSFEYSNQVEVTIAAPKEFALMQNHPNPFNPATAINYTLPVAGHVTLKIYNLIGKEVATLVNGVQDAGVKVAQFDASQLPSGIYFYTLRTNSFSATRKMMLLK
jgi:hypothetical protein